MGLVKEKDWKFLFEGKFVNGEISGKGKISDEEKKIILFEGDFFQGKIWNRKIFNLKVNIICELIKGKGLIKEYNKNNILKYEGEFLNGELNGIFKTFNYKGQPSFEGEYINGKRNGKGKEYFEGNLIFEGEYLYDHKIKGKEYVNGKIEFEGEYLYDKKWNGKGYDEYGNILYELNNGNGKVKEYLNDGSIQFDGEYLNGKKNEKCEEYNYIGKLEFEGE